jgi:hypothetical protein
MIFSNWSRVCKSLPDRPEIVVQEAGWWSSLDMEGVVLESVLSRIPNDMHVAARRLSV